MSARALPPAVPATSLRVYEPVDAFPAPERTRWATVAENPRASEQAEQTERERTWRLLLHGRAARADPATARVLRIDGVALVCPVPPHPDQEPPPGPRRNLVRAWDLPVPWLSIVRPDDRSTVGPPGHYQVPMSRARARAARALRVLAQGLGADDLTVEVEVLARWLEGFHPRSWVELDARSVAALLGGDDGVADVRLGLECLAAGDTRGAAAVYQQMRRKSRWLADLARSS